MMEGLVPIVRKNNGCDYHRIFLPLKYMGFDFNTHFEKPGIQSFDGIKAILFNRLPLNPIDKVIEQKKKHGFKIILDIDDYWELNVNHLLYNQWKKDDFVGQFLKAVKNADAVIVTNSILADKLRVLNKEIHIIPNALPFGYEQFNDSKSQSEFVRFMYAGGSTHLWDLRILNTPFTKINQHRLDKAQFILAGYNDFNKESQELWSKMENTFNLAGKLKNYERRNTLPLDNYMDHYRDADVSLVPLETNIFTAHKSNLKILEAGCKWIPAITSNTLPYSNEPNKNVLLYAGNVSTWIAHIRKCYSDAVYRKEKGQQLGEYVREHYDLLKINYYRKQLFNYLLTK